MTARVPGDEGRWERVATQWCVVTDFGLTSMIGEDGLHVFVRALSSAIAAPGMRLWLIARNNEVASWSPDVRRSVTDRASAKARSYFAWERVARKTIEIYRAASG